MTIDEQRLARPEPDTAYDRAKTPAEPLCVQGMYFSGTGTTRTIVTTVAAALEKRVNQAICELRGSAVSVTGSMSGDDEKIADSEASHPTEAEQTSSSETSYPAESKRRLFVEKAPDIDFTPPAARERSYRFRPQDIVVFGVPVIAGRVPNVLLPFLNTLEGGGAMAIPVVLYGNRNFDDALIELRNILEERGFHTVAAAAFIGEHSFSRILAAGRPDEADLQIAKRFAAAAAQKIAGLLAEAEASLTNAGTASAEPEATPSAEIGAAAGASAPAADRDSTTAQAPAAATGAAATQAAAPSAAEGSVAGGAESGFGAGGVSARMLQLLHEAGPIEVDGEDPIRPYYKPRDRQGNHINILKVKPKLDAQKCTKCGICVAACPMGSIKPEAPGVVDGICIKCCGCEKKCPEGALYFDDEGYLYHKTELELGYPDRKEPKLFV